MNTWEDIKYLYYSVARRYAEVYQEFQIDELVNEAYLRTRKYFDHEKLVNIIHFVIRNYIWEQKIKYRYEYKYHYPKFMVIDDCDELIARSEINILDEADAFLYLVGSQVNKQDRDILIKRFAQDMSWTDIAKAFNVPLHEPAYKFEIMKNLLKEVA